MKSHAQTTQNYDKKLLMASHEIGPQVSLIN